MKLDYLIEEMLNEAGIENIRKLAKVHSKAVILYHIDFDGVASCSGLKHILENEYRIKVTEVIPIQYGGRQFAIKKINDPDTLVCLVDFAQAVANVHLWTDHHSGEKAGVKSDMSTAFIDAPANAYHISTKMSKRDVFPPEDLKMISVIDSADFYKEGLTPDDIMRAAFGLDKSIDVKTNKRNLGLVVNKLILSYKNKPDFLNKLIMQSKPSLISMYNVIRRLAKQEGYNPPEKVEQEQQAYIQQQKDAIVKLSSAKEVETLGSGQNGMLGDVVVQYGGGKMGKGVQFDRYTVFKNHPEAKYLVMMWPMGMLQISANPFREKNTKVNFEQVAMKVLSNYESKWKSDMISLKNLKRIQEQDVTKKGLDDAVGYTFDNLINTFSPGQIQGIDVEKTGKWRDIVQDIANKKFKDLSSKQKDILDKVKVSIWDVIMASSGGHSTAIWNISFLNGLGKGYVDIMKKIGAQIVKEMNKL